MRGLVLTGNPGLVGMLPPQSLSGGLVLTGQHRMASGFSGPCPAPTKPAKNGGCFLPANLSKSGKQIACGPKRKTVVVKQAGGKFSLACKPLGTPGPGGDGEVTAGSATIRSVSGNTVTLSKPIGAVNAAGACPSSKPNLEMRRDAPGIAEYVGTVQARQGATYTLSFGAVGGGRVPPKVGESVYLYCANGGGVEGGGGGGFLEAGVFGGIGEGLSTITASPLFMPALLIIGGLIAWKALSRPSYTPARVRR